MTAITEKLAISAATAFGLVVVLTPAARALALRFNIVAAPCAESNHPQPTPVLGGVAIVIAVLGALGLMGELPLWLMAGMLALLVVGATDDAVVLSPLHKLLAQLAVVAFFLWAGPAAPEVGGTVTRRPKPPGRCSIEACSGSISRESWPDGLQLGTSSNRQPETFASISYLIGSRVIPTY